MIVALETEVTENSGPSDQLDIDRVAQETEVGIRNRPGTEALEVECPRLPDGSTELPLVMIS